MNEAALVSITDLAGRILYVNNRFLEVSGFSQAELLGQTHAVVNSGLHSKDFFANLWTTIAAGQHWRGEVRNRAKDGTFFWVDTIITPVVGPDGRPFQYLAIRNVITRQKENETMLLKVQRDMIQREQQLKDAQQISKTGSWHHDGKSNLLEWSEETYHIMELPVGTPASHDRFLQQVHPQDQPVIAESWAHSLAGCKPFDAEFRILTAAGEKWVRSQAKLTSDASGSYQTALGSIQDITEKKRTEDALRESESLYRSLFNNSPFSIGIIEKASTRFVEINKTAIDLYGYSREEFLQLTVLDMREKGDHNKIREQLANGSYSADNSVRVHRKKNGDTLIAAPTISDIEYQGKAGYLVTIQDITEHSRIEAALQEATLSRQKDMVQAQEESRSAIGRELHDNINQLLVAASLYIRNVVPATDTDKRMIDTGLKIMAEANEEIRRLSASLVVPSINEVNLQDSIETLCHCLKLSHIDVKLHVNVMEHSLPENLKINVYRIVQEQVNNIVKYAQAKQVRIEIAQTEERLCLDVIDNGRGFDMKQLHKGIGLKNMLFRAEAYHGHFQIETEPGAGCRLRVDFPLKD